MLPKDPNMLLSVINMKLRDQEVSLDEVAASYCVPKSDIVDKLAKAGFRYDEKLNRFVAS